MAKAYFTIEVDLPDGVSASEFRAYAETEIRAGKGGLHPDDPLFNLERSSVKVRSVATPNLGVVYRPQNHVVAEQVQSKSRLHRQGETPVKVFKTSLKPRW
jgi:hypothetical protein